MIFVTASIGQESTVRWESVVQLLTLLIVFVFVLALTYFSTKWVGKYQKEKLLGNNIQILESVRISNSKYIQIVKIGSQYFAVAVCKDNMTCLGELNGQDLAFKDASAEFKSENFKAILDKFKKDKPEE